MMSICEHDTGIVVVYEKDTCPLCELQCKYVSLLRDLSIKDGEIAFLSAKLQTEDY